MGFKKLESKKFCLIIDYYHKIVGFFFTASLKESKIESKKKNRDPRERRFKKK